MISVLYLFSYINNLLEKYSDFIYRIRASSKTKTVFALQWLEYINTWVEEFSDKRIEKWPMMGSVQPVFWLCMFYLFFVTSLGPKLMEKQRPFNLKNVIIVYNMLQVATCATLCIWILRHSPSMGCMPVQPFHPETLLYARIGWWTSVLKLAEFLETVFFVLRKKQKQVSGLHVYHHISTFAVCWAATKMFPSKMLLTPILLNCFVHTLMYTYYLMSAIGNPNIQRFISKLKRYLTIIQMIQFGILVIFTTQILNPQCKVPNMYAYIFIPNVFLVFYLFYKFYRDAYLENSRNSTRTENNPSLATE